MTAHYWPDEYLGKRRDPAEAIRMIKAGQRIFIGTSCGEPQALIRELTDQSRYFADLEVMRILSLETVPLTFLAAETEGRNLTVRSFYLGSCKPKALSENKRFVTPINLSALPRLFISRRIPVHAALIQVSPPDDFGWMSLGISVDATKAAAEAADLVICQVNQHMPRVLGQSFIHVNDVDVIVEHDEELLTIDQPPTFPAADQIGRQVARLIDDGSTLQLPLGATPQAIMLGLAEKNDLGVHTQFMSDSILSLISMGVINNRRKEIHTGKSVASGAIGTKNLYEFLNDNPGVSFFPSDYVNDPAVISQHDKMVSLNVAMAMDLTGQVAADALPYNHFTGVSGIMDFIRGSTASPHGKSILMIPSTTLDGQASRIAPRLENVDMVVPRGDVHYVVSEYGTVNLFGKTLEERAMAMISIAHPDFRDELMDAAKDMGLIGRSRTMADSLQGVYPFRLEEERTIDGSKVFFRPARPVDQRLLQEHFYELDHDSVVKRFMHEKQSFNRSEVAGMYQVDYKHDLTIVAVVGDLGFEKAIAVGGYYLDPATNLAEVAYSVSPQWQRRGLSGVIQAKLAQAARDNGIAGLVAYTSPQNQGMAKLFKKLPYKVTSTYDGDMIELKTRFDQPA
jgi:acyl-CoA hydrolase